MIPVYVYVTLKDFKVSHWLSKVIRVVKQFAMTPAISGSLQSQQCAKCNL